MGFTINRQDAPVIVFDQDAPGPIRFAASELKRYLEQILRTALPEQGNARAPKIILEEMRDESLGDEGYQLVCSGNTFRIAGGGPAGVVYGTYELLRGHCGCQFSGLGPEGEFVPEQDKIFVKDCEERVQPQLWYRGMQFYGKRDLSLIIKQLDWMAKNGMNYAMVSPLPDLPVYWIRKPGQPGTAGISTSAPEGRYTNSWFRQNLLPEITKRGLKVDMGHHNLLAWLPPELYFEEHPEWYALVDGKRVADPHQFCVCTSNQTAVETIIANMKAYLRENPEVSIVGLIPEDGYGMCQCEECRKLDYEPDDAFRIPGDWTGAHTSPEAENRSKIRRYALLANQVARAIRAEFPNVLLGYAAYVDIQWPPRDVLLESNIVPWVAIYWRCGAHLLSPEGCDLNQFFFDILEQWREAHQGKLILYEYYMGMGSQLSLPYPIAEVICREWPGLKKLGIDGATIQTTAHSVNTYANNYLAFARSGWQERVDYENLLSDFLLGMFGSAADEVHPIYQEFQQALKRVETEGSSSPYLRREERRGCFLPDGRNICYLTEDNGFEFVLEQIQRAEKRASDERERIQVRNLASAARYWQIAAELVEMEEKIAEARRQGDAKQVGLLSAQAFFEFEHKAEEISRLEQEGWVAVNDFASSVWRFRQEADVGELVKRGRMVFEATFRDDAYLKATVDGVEEEGSMREAGQRIRRAAKSTMQIEVDDLRALEISINGEQIPAQDKEKARIAIEWQDSPKGKKQVSWKIEAAEPE